MTCVRSAYPPLFAFPEIRKAEGANLRLVNRLPVVELRGIEPRTS